MEENSTKNLEENAWGRTYKWMQKKQNNFGVKYKNKKNRKAKWINNVEKELQRVEEGDILLGIT